MRFETSFDLDGDLIVIPATVVGPSASIDIRLVLDTGAVLTTLSPAIAHAVGFHPEIGIRPTVTRTAAANERGYLVRLVELSTLGVVLPAVYANVADLGYGLDGVLGMNVLLDFNLEIRPAERRIFVAPIAP